MPIEERIRISLLIEKMNKQQTYSERLGLENKSTFHGKIINKEEESETC